MTDWALNHGMTVNEFYFARSLDESLEKNRQSALQDLSDDTVFVFKNQANCAEYDLNCYMVDGLSVGYSKTIGGYEKSDTNLSGTGSFPDGDPVFYSP